MPPSESQPKRTIEQLKKEFDLLNERKIQTKTQLEEANLQLQKLEQEATDQFGTADIDELKKKLAEMETENEQRRRNYQTLLDGISADLKKVENDTALTGAANKSDE